MSRSRLQSLFFFDITIRTMESMREVCFLYTPCLLRMFITTSIPPSCPLLLSLGTTGALLTSLSSNASCSFRTSFLAIKIAIAAIPIVNRGTITFISM
ncbi:hypothetical protein ATCV1_Z449R [Acanthocystis turfacea chlorella virus 1]|uniref:Uncharacterized protein Z449R n=1 Tax=Chlorovirus heliozoae TaxID=322019 RepID=A7K959_9PHYC|nr:hypothetical protein ATCV1_Z449R [Acanthocystis turfacea chlorella virus 1]ABT16583.1 hypothetical protein ATCV1_Z449R [Acanthocystis turfacea chlorella virus 1]